MEKSRRDFLRNSGLAGLGFAAATLPIACSSAKKTSFTSQGQFNMDGYAAPKIENVRIGFIGVGSRGRAAVARMSQIQGVTIIAIADINPQRTDEIIRLLEPTVHKPAVYAGTADAWKKLSARQDIDLVYICTPWSLHTEMCVFAMEHGKHAAVEVPAAQTIEDCWMLVETSERTRMHCMMLENCCYDFFELLTLNMTRQGIFGDIIHGEGAYIHSRTENVLKHRPNWRVKENQGRNGNLYPTHGLGPICQIMNINRGDRLTYMSSMSGNDFTLEPAITKLSETREDWKPYLNKKFRGNMNVSIIRTELGRTIMLQHDVSSPRVYSRIHLVSGTKASAQKYPLPAKIHLEDHKWITDAEMRKIEEQYSPLIVKKIGDVAKQIGGHGGMDMMMDWRLIDCLRNGLPLDMTVYDAAIYSCIEPLSEWSVANRSNSIDIPDFTRGAWKTNKPILDINLERGGASTVIVPNEKVERFN